ncbi:MAG TPA: TerB family tellurite resistance protein [Candidatus Saccharimonadales bacterium]|nr:TerB family tellurite resistance protein [Candidatus Saccharimonadales bacterium]
MFRRIFGKDHEPAADQAEAALTKAVDPNGDTATVRRIVAKLEAMPPERARLAASAAYTVARAAYADLVITDDEADIIERELQDRAGLDEPTAVLVTEMARLQAKTVGGTEDYVVTREFKALSTHEQRVGLLRACFAVGAASGSISAEESAVVNQIANELDIESAELNALRAEYHEQLSAVQAVRRIADQTD